MSTLIDEIEVTCVMKTQKGDNIGSLVLGGHMRRGKQANGTGAGLQIEQVPAAVAGLLADQIKTIQPPAVVSDDIRKAFDAAVADNKELRAQLEAASEQSRKPGRPRKS